MNGQVIIGLKDYLIANKMLVISPIADDSALTRDSYFNYFFRANEDAIADRYHVSGYVAFKKGWRHVIAMAPDFIPGREDIQGFKEVFEPLGGKVDEEIYIPFGTTDYAPYFAKIDPDEIDGIYVFEFGGDAISFVKQWSEYGLKDKVPVLGEGINDGALLQAEGDAAVGMETMSNYSTGIDTQMNKDFIAAYKAKYNMDVDFHAPLGYTTAKLYMLGIEAVNGDTKNVDGMVAAIEKADLQLPGGPFKYGPNHAPIRDYYLRRIDKVNGVLTETVLETFKNIEQGWMPDELKNK
jgi:branched-chain amino acid transport system substrate-binding protein